MRKGTKMSSDICVQLRERGEDVAADFIERLGKRFVDEERKCLILERAYSQQQKVWSEAISRRDKLEALFPAILEYLEQEADVIDGGNGIPSPNTAMSLLVWTRHALEEEGKND
jgi:hypothetical protein